MEPIKVYRNQLYDEIWAEPVRTVAKRYGISDVALAKICRKLNIPRPPVGHWVRKEHGYKIEQAPLPPLRPGGDTVATISPPRPRLRLSSAVQARLAADRNAHIPVKSRLVGPHPLVAATAEALTIAKRTPSNLFARTPRLPHLDIRVTSKTVDRALRIMDALITALEAKGFGVKVTSKGGTQVEVLGEKLSISLDETNRQVAHVLTAEERERQIRYAGTWIPKWDYEPTGLLRFRINEWGGQGARKTWIDGQRHRLDDMLHQIVAGLVTFAEGERLAREERDRQHREWEAERARHAELERRRQEEEAHRQQLEREAEAWARTKSIRDYVDAVESEAKARVLAVDAGTAIRQWLDWAREHALLSSLIQWRDYRPGSVRVLN
jgi:hypothetical protein